MLRARTDASPDGFGGGVVGPVFDLAACPANAASRLCSRVQENTRAMGESSRGLRCSTERSSTAAPDLVDVLEQIGRIFIDPSGAAALEFVGPVSSRQQSHSESVAAPCGQHVPDAVADNDRILDGALSRSAAAMNSSGSGFACLT